MSNNDILTEVLDDAELRTMLVLALKIALRTDPASFYEKYVMPRLQKLQHGTPELDFIEMTAEEEARFMDNASAALLKEKGCLDENGNKLPPYEMAKQSYAHDHPELDAAKTACNST